MTWDVDDIMPGSEGLIFLLIYEKSELRFDSGRGRCLSLFVSKT